MLIDWFTVGAQAINFLILVVLMKKFLYKPILDSIEAREALIAKELADAAQQAAEAQKQNLEYQQKNAAIDRERHAMLAEALLEAKEERARLFAEARKAVIELQAKNQATLKADAKESLQAIQQRIKMEVFAIAHKALMELSSSNLEQQVCTVFLERLHSLNPQVKNAFAEAVHNTTNPLLVRSAFALSPELQKTIQASLSAEFAQDVKLCYETNADMVAGIEFSVNGQMVAWSIANYLGALEKGIDTLLQQNDKQAPDELKT